MTSSNHYDQNLLGSAQAPTKSQLQEGYNVDLLDEGRPVRSPSHAARSTTRDLEAAVASGNVSREKVDYKGTAVKQTFFGSTKGKITILIAALVIIGAVVGGAVGGTVHHNNKASLTISNGTSPISQGASPVSQGASPISQGASPSSQEAGGDTNTTAGGIGVGTGSGAKPTRTPIASITPTGSK